MQQVTLPQLQRELSSQKSENQDQQRLIGDLQRDIEEQRHTRIHIEEEYKITIDKYVKEVRETHIKLTKVNNIKMCWAFCIDLWCFQ